MKKTLNKSYAPSATSRRKSGKVEEWYDLEPTDKEWELIAKES